VPGHWSKIQRRKAEHYNAQYFLQQQSLAICAQIGKQSMIFSTEIAGSQQFHCHSDYFAGNRRCFIGSTSFKIGNFLYNGRFFPDRSV